MQAETAHSVSASCSRYVYRVTVHVSTTFGITQQTHVSTLFMSRLSLTHVKPFLSRKVTNCCIFAARSTPPAQTRETFLVPQTRILNSTCSSSPIFDNINKERGSGSSAGIVTDYWLDGPVSNPGGDEIFCPSRPALGPTQPPVQWVPSPFRG